jgi:uncharacterized membrane protein
MRGAALVLIAHTVHVLLAGAWLGGVLFTTLVVSPALKAMKWGEAERVGVRAAIGRRYARVGRVNLALLAVFALADGIFGGFGASLYAEYALVLLLFGLVAAHGVFFGRRIGALAEAERGSADVEDAASFARRRQGLQRLSLRVSWVNLAVSAAVAALAANA